MESALYVISLFVAGLLVFAALFQALDILWDRSSKEQLRERIVAFWVNTAELEFVEQLHRALNKRYERMRALRGRFIKLFWTFCAALAVFMTIGVLSSDKPRSDDHTFLISAEFLTRNAVHCYRTTETDTIGADCILNVAKHFDKPDQRPNRDVQEVKFHALVASLTQRQLLLSDIVSTTGTILILALPLTLALTISLNITLWILSKITESRLKLLFLILLDLVIALVMPPLLASIFMFIFVGGTQLLVGQIIGFASFEQVNWLTFTLATVAAQINLNFIFWAVLAFVPWMGDFAATAPLALVAFVTDRLAEFISGTTKLLRLDFSTGFIDAVINWAIFTDLLFSIFYLGPSLLLVLANRSNSGRAMFLNIVMWVGDHPRGPLIAIAELLAALFSFIGRLFSGHK